MKKFKLIMIAAGVLIVVSIIGHYRRLKAGETAPGSPGSTIHAPTVVERQPLPPYPLKDGVIELNVVTIGSEKEVWWNMKPGEKLKVAPRMNVPFKQYINHQLYRQVGGENPTQTSWAFQEMKSMGFKTDQGEMEFAYIKYRGIEAPSNWFEAAFQTQRVAGK